jgi:hypothetical protein
VATSLKPALGRRSYRGVSVWLGRLAATVFQPPARPVVRTLVESRAVGDRAPFSYPSSALLNCPLEGSGPRAAAMPRSSSARCSTRSRVSRVCWSRLRHELEHAAGRRDHGREFKALAIELGLTGPMTATFASPELLDFINWALLPQLGKDPHGAKFENGKLVERPDDQEVISKPRDQGGHETGRACRSELPRQVGCLTGWGCMDGLRHAGWAGR